MKRGESEEIWFHGDFIAIMTQIESLLAKWLGNFPAFRRFTTEYWQNSHEQGMNWDFVAPWEAAFSGRGFSPQYYL